MAFDDLDNYQTGFGASNGDEAGSKLGRIDHFALIDQCGEGSCGPVYRVLDEESGKDVVLKKLPALITQSPDELSRIKDSFKHVLGFTHSFVAAALALHKVGEADAVGEEQLDVRNGDYLVVVEYVAGSPLSNWRRQFKDSRAPVEEAVAICAKVAEALDQAHAKGILHRDLRPSNVMAEVSGGVKVLDFSQAAEIRSSFARLSSKPAHSRSTRPYMAPEMWLGGKPGPASDQYSLAVLFYELVSGEAPFRSVFDTGDATLMLNAVRQEQPARLSQLSRKQNRALFTALDKDPQRRFPSCCDLTNELERSGKRRRRGRSKMAAGVERSKKRQGGGFGGILLRLTAFLIMLAAAAGGVWAFRDHDKVKPILARAEPHVKRVWTPVEPHVKRVWTPVKSQAVALWARVSGRPPPKPPEPIIPPPPPTTRAEVVAAKGAYEAAAKEVDIAKLERFASGVWRDIQRAADQGATLLAEGSLAEANTAFAKAAADLAKARQDAEAARQAFLVADKDEKIRQLVAAAEAALAGSKTPASADLYAQLHKLDPESSGTKWLRQELSGRLEAAAKGLQKRSIEVLDLDRADGFAPRLEALKASIADARKALDKNEFGAVSEVHKRIKAECDALIELDRGRRHARGAMTYALEQRRSAEVNKAETDPGWQMGAKAIASAQAALAKMSFAEARTHFQRAGTEFRAAATRAQAIGKVEAAQRAFEKAFASVDRKRLDEFGGVAWANVRAATSEARLLLQKKDLAAATMRWSRAQELLAEAAKAAAEGKQVSRADGFGALFDKIKEQELNATTFLDLQRYGPAADALRKVAAEYDRIAKLDDARSRSKALVKDVEKARQAAAEAGVAGDLADVDKLVEKAQAAMAKTEFAAAATLLQQAVEACLAATAKAAAKRQAAAARTAYLEDLEKIDRTKDAAPAARLDVMVAVAEAGRLEAAGEYAAAGRLWVKGRELLPAAAAAKPDDTDPADGFQALLEKAAKDIVRADELLIKGAHTEALAIYQALKIEYARIAKLDGERQLAQTARSAASAAKRGAAKRNAEEGAKTQWAIATATHDQARAAVAKMDFKEAERLFQEVVPQYAKAAREAVLAGRLEAARAPFEEALGELDAARLAELGGEAWANVMIAVVEATRRAAKQDAEGAGENWQKATELLTPAAQAAAGDALDRADGFGPLLDAADEQRQAAKAELEKEAFAPALEAYQELQKEYARLRQLDAERRSARPAMAKATTARQAAAKEDAEAGAKQQWHNAQKTEAQAAAAMAKMDFKEAQRLYLSVAEGYGEAASLSAAAAKQENERQHQLEADRKKAEEARAAEEAVAKAEGARQAEEAAAKAAAAAAAKKAAEARAAEEAVAKAEEARQAEEAAAKAAAAAAAAKEEERQAQLAAEQKKAEEARAAEEAAAKAAAAAEAEQERQEQLAAEQKKAAEARAAEEAAAKAAAAAKAEQERQEQLAAERKKAEEARAAEEAAAAAKKEEERQAQLAAERKKAEEAAAKAAAAQSAAKQREPAQEARQAAEKAGAPKDAKELWTEAEKLLADAAKAFQDGAFAEAEAQWPAAAKAYARATTQAQAKRAVDQAKSAYDKEFQQGDRPLFEKFGAKNWQKVVATEKEAARQAVAAEFVAAAQSWKRAKELLPAAALEAVMGAAADAAKRQNWSEAVGYAEGALTLDPNYGPARQLRDAAAKHVPPRLRVRSYIGDREVEGAAIAINGAKQAVVTPAVFGAGKGATYQIEVSLPPQDGVRYRPYKTTVTMPQFGIANVRAVLTADGQRRK